LLDLGFNDKGESIPFQGGTNEEVVDRLYKTLRKEKKEQHLKVYWYTGKDQVRPLNAVKKQRNCHIKFAAYDDEVLIIGNGNQDSQSWFHSQEVNVMVDSKVRILLDAHSRLYDNQGPWRRGRAVRGVELTDTGDCRRNDGNTAVQPKYDRVRTRRYRRDLRDSEGKTLKDYGATSDGKFRGLSGFIQFAKTI
jgi:phosphatidylserine/phosphatidylglycerophosphate/cardiolipin synthase-like enzyme